MWPAYKAFADWGEKQSSRNGAVLRLPGVTTITISRPEEKVNFCHIRDANPFFHYFESLLMLGGNNDAIAMAAILPSMIGFSDNGITFNAFYGTRIRKNGKRDQLNEVIKLLRKDPNTRQAVIQIWDSADLVKQTKDKACNISMLFEISRGNRGLALNMTLFNRSNDAVWGTISGANIFHFAMFHQYVATALKIPMGEWTTVSNNLHVYVDNPKWEKLEHYYSVSRMPSHMTNPYDDFRDAAKHHLVRRLNKPRTGEELQEIMDDSFLDFYRELRHQMSCGWVGFTATDRRSMPMQMLSAFASYKNKNKAEAITTLEKAIIPLDIKTASIKWLHRRK
tara:strand:+ start:4988 stop:5998 length:1011 start_codon:yes stop_codon:yes gene_type:complete